MAHGLFTVDGGHEQKLKFRAGQKYLGPVGILLRKGASGARQ